jgi:serine/threonine protein kinase
MYTYIYIYIYLYPTPFINVYIYTYIYRSFGVLLFKLLKLNLPFDGNSTPHAYHHLYFDICICIYTSLYIYRSFGVLLFELLKLNLPFDGKSTGELVRSCACSIHKRNECVLRIRYVFLQLFYYMYHENQSYYLNVRINTAYFLRIFTIRINMNT